MRSPGRTRALLVGAAAAVSVVAGACGADSDPETASPAGAVQSGTKILTIEDFAFGPDPLVVPKGTVVKVVNKDDAAHTATADGGSFDTGTLEQGASKEVTLSEPGEIAYHCTIHDYMQGVIRVSA